jgi:YD repeat-containing protein
MSIGFVGGSWTGVLECERACHDVLRHNPTERGWHVSEIKPASGDSNDRVDKFNQRTTVVYDASGRIIGEVRPLGERRTFVYGGHDRATGHESQQQGDS